MRKIVVEFVEFDEVCALYQLDFAKEWDSCSRCENLARSRSKVVHGSGNPNADLLILGEGPWDEEDEAGVPFVGDSGTVLNTLLDQYKMTRADVFVDNVVPCKPTMNSGGRLVVRPPTKQEVKNCIMRLYQTIITVDPLLILGLGKTILHTLTGDTTLSITKVHGELRMVKVPGMIKMISYPLIPCYHPSFVLRNPSESKNGPMAQFQRDFHYAVRMLKLLKQSYEGKGTK